MANDAKTTLNWCNRIALLPSLSVTVYNFSRCWSNCCYTNGCCHLIYRRIKQRSAITIHQISDKMKMVQVIVTAKEITGNQDNENHDKNNNINRAKHNMAIAYLTLF